MLTVITGPPCSGKTTYLNEHAKPGHIRIDYDQLAQAFGSPDHHNHPDHIKWVTQAARRAAIGEAIRQHRKGHIVWLIDSAPTVVRRREYAEAGARIVALTADKAELHRRAAADRPGLWHQLIDNWTPVGAPAPPRRTRIPGQPRSKHRTGRPYLRARARMFAMYGRTCHLCGHGGATDADHLVPISVDSRQPVDPHGMRPAHGVHGCPVCGRKCNQARGSTPVRAAYQAAVQWSGSDPVSSVTVDVTPALTW